jgi:hypothetical protein
VGLFRRVLFRPVLFAGPISSEPISTGPISPPIVGENELSLRVVLVLPEGIKVNAGVCVFV